MASYDGSVARRGIDHADGDFANNKWANLRAANQSENSRNRRTRCDNSLGLKGVYRAGTRYAARIFIGKKEEHLGCFGTAEEAHAAYIEAAKSRFGEFARAS